MANSSRGGTCTHFLFRAEDYEELKASKLVNEVDLECYFRERHLLEANHYVCLEQELAMRNLRTSLAFAFDR